MSRFEVYVVTGECRVMSPGCMSLILIDTAIGAAVPSKRVCYQRDAPISKCPSLKQRIMPCNVLGSCLAKRSVEGPGCLITVSSPSVPFAISTTVASNMNIYIYLLQRVIDCRERGCPVVHVKWPIS